MSLDFFPCKIPILYDASYVYDACNVLVKSYSKSIVATTHGIVLVKSTTGRLYVGLNKDDISFENIGLPFFYLFVLPLTYLKRYSILFFPTSHCCLFPFISLEVLTISPPPPPALVSWDWSLLLWNAINILWNSLPIINAPFIDNRYAIFLLTIVNTHCYGEKTDPCFVCLRQKKKCLSFLHT